MRVEQRAAILVDTLELGNFGLQLITEAITEAVQAAYVDAAAVVDGQAETWPVKSTERSELKRVAIALRNRAKEVTQ